MANWELGIGNASWLATEPSLGHGRNGIAARLVNRTWAILLAGLIFPVVMVPRAHAEDTANPATRDSAVSREVGQLLRDLDAASRATRQAAEKRLLELGPAVVSHLPPPELLPNAAVRDAVARVRIELERRQARASIEPSRVTLRGIRPLRDWIAELTRQSGNAIDVSDVAADVLDRPVGLQMEGEPFWNAVALLSTRTETRLRSDRTSRRLRLDASGPAAGDRELSADYRTPFRIAATSVQSREIAGRTDRQLVRIGLEVTPEPRLRPLFVQFAASDCTAKAGDRELLPHNPDASYELPVAEGGGRFPITLDFVAPAKLDREPLRIRGRFNITTAAGSEAIRFSELAQAVTNRLGVARRRGGVTVTLHKAAFAKAELRGHEARVAVSVAYDSGGPAFESHRQWMLHNEVFLETSDGQRVALNGGHETSRQADGAIAVEYRFVNLPDPLPNYQFVYVAPTLIIDVPVDFELRGIKW